MSFHINQRQLYSVICHGSSLLSSLIISIAIPIIILLVIDDYVVKQNAKQVINFQFHLLILFISSGILFLITFSEWLAALLILVCLFCNLFVPIIAIVRVSNNPNQVYDYGLKQYV